MFSAQQHTLRAARAEQPEPPFNTANDLRAAPQQSCCCSKTNTTLSHTGQLFFTPNGVCPFQEIERLVLDEFVAKLEPTPEGHRAPIAELFAQQRRSVSTQTPYSLDSDEWDEFEQFETFDAMIEDQGHFSSGSRDSAISDDDHLDGSRCPSRCPSVPYSPVHMISGELTSLAVMQRDRQRSQREAREKPSQLATCDAAVMKYN